VAWFGMHGVVPAASSGDELQGDRAQLVELTRKRGLFEVV
jgi:hypothetical protein